MHAFSSNSLEAEEGGFFSTIQTLCLTVQASIVSAEKQLWSGLDLLCIVCVLSLVVLNIVHHLSPVSLIDCVKLMTCNLHTREYLYPFLVWEVFHYYTFEWTFCPFHFLKSWKAIEWPHPFQCCRNILLCRHPFSLFASLAYFQSVPRLFSILLVPPSYPHLLKCFNFVKCIFQIKNLHVIFQTTAISLLSLETFLWVFFFFSLNFLSFPYPSFYFSKGSGML